MAIVKMRKFTLLFPEDQKADLLKKLQRFEQVHFRPLEPEMDAELDFLKRDGPGPDETGIENEMAKVRFALEKLAPYDPKPKGLAALRADPPAINYEDFVSFGERFDHREICATIKEQDDRIGACKQEAARLSAYMDELRLWLKLDASTAELKQLRATGHMFGLVNRASLDQLVTAIETEFSTAYTEVVGQIKEDVILLVLGPSDIFDEISERLKGLGFSKTTPGFDGMPETLIIESRSQLIEAEKTEAEAVGIISDLAIHCDNLRILLDYYETRLGRTQAVRNFLHSQTIVVCEGWLPDTEVAAFEGIVQEACGDACYYELEEVPKDSEEVPIKLKNNAIIAPFESIVTMYALPKYGEIDPTPVMAPFYTFFFGLMLGDVGYGILMVVATLIALNLFKFKESTRKFISFFFFLGLGTIVGGAVYGSIFGLSPEWLKFAVAADGTRKAILDTNSDIVTMLVASVVVGVFQILFGIGVKGYVLIRDGKPLDALFDSGFWIITLIGGIGFILKLAGMTPEPYGAICQWMFIGGVIGLALTQGRSSPSIGGKIGNGLYGVYGLSSYVGDFVSYTRIAALALSGAYISFSFNLMVGMIMESSNILIAFVGGGLVFVLGQALNFGLSALSAYVHTCRLMYVEYFGKFFEGGGKPFTPFKLINNFVKVEK